MAITTVHVSEICMALPDVICVIVRDQEIEKGGLLELASPDAAAYGAIVQRDPVTGGAGSSYAWVVGQKNGVQKMFLKFGDTKPTAFLNRATVDNPANWPTIGGQTVTAVYRKTYPLDQGISLEGGSQFLVSTMEHQLFVQLSGNLPQGGPYTISCAGAFPSTAFTFSDTTTRAVGLQASVVGARPSDQSKIANFSLWIPGRGTEGRVNLPVDYGLSSFELINQAGVTVFSGTMTQYIAPTEQEGSIPLTDYASSTVPPKVATGISRQNPCRVTVPSHGFTTGQKKILRNFGIAGGNYFDESMDGATFTITVIDANTFSIPVDTSGRPTAYTAGVFDSGHDSLVYDVISANYYNTTVNHADFSGFTTAGLYRVRIPGLGVSDEFPISATARLDDAVTAMKAYYNQLSGVALDDAIGGWERPVDFKHGVNGVSILYSKLPAYFSHEAFTSASGSPYESDSPGASPWITATTVPNWTISIRDAGDWDYHCYRHCIMAYWLVEFGYLQLPSNLRDVELGFPKASTLLGSTYSGIDSLGSAVHMALAQLDTFRSNQQADGRVYGGFQFGPSANSGGGSLIEPSYCTTQNVFVLEGDPESTLHYALAAAKMAHMFSTLGFSTLATTWQTSALAAWNWAETMYQEYLANVGSANLNSATNIQAHFNTRCNYQTNLGLTDAQFKSAITLMFTATYTQIRTAVAGMLYRLTGLKSPYGDILSAQFAVSAADEFPATGAWEFYQNPNVNTDYATPQPQGAYYSDRWLDATSQSSDFQLIRAFLCSQSTRQPTNVYLKRLQDLVAFTSGRHQLGKSVTTGVGSRYPRNTLIRDREAMSLPTSNTPGIPNYNNALKTTQGGVSPNNFSTDGPLNFTAESPTGLYESTGGRAKLITPIRYLYPINESFRDNSFMIYMTEFTTQQSIVPRLIMALIMHAYAAEPATRRSSLGRFRFRGA